MDDRRMRDKIDRELDALERRRLGKTARLAAAVGASGKLLAGCIVAEYGAPLYGVAEYAAPFDAATTDTGDSDASDAAGIDLGAVVEYGGPFDAGDIDIGEVVDYAAPFDAGVDEDGS
jgi:hypothetical protein